MGCREFRRVLFRSALECHELGSVRGVIELRPIIHTKPKQTARNQAVYHNNKTTGTQQIMP